MIAKVINTNKKSKEFEKFIAELRKLQRKEIEYGFFEEDVYSDSDVSPVTGNPSGYDGLPVAQVAQWNNDGVGDIPTRNFYDRAEENNKNDIKTDVKRGLNLMAHGIATSDDLLRSLGETVVENIVKEIEDFSSPPNHPYTVEDKGFNDPLVFSGKMKDSVKAKIK